MIQFRWETSEKGQWAACRVLEGIVALQVQKFDTQKGERCKVSLAYSNTHKDIGKHFECSDIEEGKKIAESRWWDFMNNGGTFEDIEFRI